MSKKRIIIGAAVVVLIVVVLVFISTRKRGSSETSVQTAKVERQRIVETVTATGRIQPITQVKISADVAAKITHLGVKEGDWVEKGELLVQLDRERFLATVEQAEANLRSVEANALLAKENEIKAEKDYARTNELFEKKLESQAILDQAYAAHQVEKSSLQICA